LGDECAEGQPNSGPLAQRDSLIACELAGKTAILWPRDCACVGSWRPAGRDVLAKNKYSQLEEISMLRWALTFLIVALLASAFGMWGLEGTAMEIARILFFVFFVLLVISLVTGRRVPVD
jgi:uncharacterized membrane protein YtjA (UPF0391 family)